MCYVIFADRVLGASNFLLAPLELGFFGGGLSLSTFAVILRFFGMGFSTENSYVTKISPVFTPKPVDFLQMPTTNYNGGWIKVCDLW